MIDMIEKSACILNLENGDIMRESIQRLLDEGVEVVAIDNNSQDCSKDVLKSFKGKIIYKINKSLKGQSENRNWMIKQTHGEYILLLDSDILYEPKTFDYLIQRLKTAPEQIKCIGFNPWYYTNIKAEVQKDLPPLDAPLENCGQPIAFTQYGVFKRELFFKYNIWFDENFGTGYGSEDNDYALQMLQKGFKCACISFKYYHNKHTEHWYALYNVDTMRVKERQEYFKAKWGQDVYQKYYGFEPLVDNGFELYKTPTSPTSPTSTTSTTSTSSTPTLSESTLSTLPPLLTKVIQLYGHLPKVMVGVGICPRTEYARDLFMNWFRNITYPNVELFIDENSGEENARASRERIRNKFMKSNCKFLLFCDVDTIPPYDVIERLLLHKKDIVSGITTAKEDANVIAFWKAGYPEQWQKKELIQKGELIAIDGSGLYCCLVSRPVLEKILFNWHSVIDDVEFYTRAKIIGFQPYLDPTIRCKHYRDKNNFYTI